MNATVTCEPELADPPALSPALPPRLRRAAAWVRGLTVLGALALLLLPPWFWLSDGWLASQAAEATAAVGGRFTLDTRARWAMAAVALPSLLLAARGLWRLWALSGEYLAARVFSPAALRHLHGFARALLGLAVLAPLVRTGTVLALTWGNPPGQRLLVLSLSSQDYLNLLLAAVFGAVATVMAHAAALADEHAQFV